jgi:hypothetical protein
MADEEYIKSIGGKLGATLPVQFSIAFKSALPGRHASHV